MHIGTFIRRLQASAAAQQDRQRLRVYIERDQLETLILRLQNAHEAVRLRDRKVERDQADYARADYEHAQWLEHSRQQAPTPRGRA